jgi:hypothetical protein
VFRGNNFFHEEKAMPIELKRAYLTEIRERYKKSPKKKKTAILNEFCITCRYTRKYAIRILRGSTEPRIKKRCGAKPKYDAIRAHLKSLWEQMGKMCSKKMKAAFPLWLPFYKQATTEEKLLLLKISPSTMDRYLEAYRGENKARGLSTTIPVLKHQIPIKLIDSEIHQPGYIESDTVSHCGDNAAGSFASSLTMTDLFSGWTANAATWTKQAIPVVEKIKETENELPFALLGFASDNGNEFINEELASYFKDRAPSVDFVRRRPGRKNDNAHVEQKNFTHVRNLFGYDRFDDPSLVPLMNEIYRLYWNPLWNYFTPVMKLKEKKRIGSKVVKKWDDPKTPCQRLIDSDKIPQQTMNHLRQTLKAKNPFFLRRELEKKLKQFWAAVEEVKRKRNANPAA